MSKFDKEISLNLAEYIDKYSKKNYNLSSRNKSTNPNEEYYKKK